MSTVRRIGALARPKRIFDGLEEDWAGVRVAFVCPACRRPHEVRAVDGHPLDRLPDRALLEVVVAATDIRAELLPTIQVGTECACGVSYVVVLGSGEFQPCRYMINLYGVFVAAGREPSRHCEHHLASHVSGLYLEVGAVCLA
nr:hypothetical protein [Micromonospora sp. DSM 115978]